MSTRPKQLALAPRLTLVVILIFGLFCAWFFTWMMIDSVSRLFGSSTGYKQLVFTEQGEPLISTHPGVQELTEPIYHTLDGKLVPNPSEVVLLDDYPREVLPNRPNLDAPSSSLYLDWGMSLLGFAALSPARTYWYLIHDFETNGRAYLVGYDAVTRRQIGFFGRRGFSATIPPPEDRIQIPFTMLMSGGLEGNLGSRGELPRYEPQRRFDMLLVSGDDLLKINLSAQTVAQIPLPGKVITLGRYVQHIPVGEGAKSEEVDRIVVRLADELHFLNEQGEPQGRLPLPPNLRDKTIVLRSVNPDEIIVESSSPLDRYGPHELTWFSRDGAVLRSATVDIYQRPPESAKDDWMFALIMPAPALIVGMSPLDAYFKVQRGEQPDMRAAMLDQVHKFWLPVTVLVLVCLALAVWTYRRHRRYEARGAVAWALFVLLLGPLALVAYLVHRQWPARRTCEHCGRKVPVDRADCLACAAAFPAPTLRGFEVFA